MLNYTNAPSAAVTFVTFYLMGSPYFIQAIFVNENLTMKAQRAGAKASGEKGMDILIDNGCTYPSPLGPG